MWVHLSLSVWVILCVLEQLYESGWVCLSLTLWVSLGGVCELGMRVEPIEVHVNLWNVHTKHSVAGCRLRHQDTFEQSKAKRRDWHSKRHKLPREFHPFYLSPTGFHPFVFITYGISPKYFHHPRDFTLMKNQTTTGFFNERCTVKSPRGSFFTEEMLKRWKTPWGGCTTLNLNRTLFWRSLNRWEKKVKIFLESFSF